jgi:hypothetical protein
VHSLRVYNFNSRRNGWDEAPPKTVRLFERVITLPLLFYLAFSCVRVFSPVSGSLTLHLQIENLYSVSAMSWKVDGSRLALVRAL